ncbi:MAG: NACHT domain-containing protein [Bacteroidota bacterium]
MQVSCSPILNPDEVNPKALTDLKAEVDGFLKQKKKCFLLLQGNSGGGKTVCGRFLEQELWKERKKSDDPIPLFISLPSVHEKGSRELIEAKFKEYGLDDPAIEKLKGKRFLFILDAFDEIKQKYYDDEDFPNVFSERFRFKQWPKSKFIVTCRRNALIQGEKESLFGEKLYERYLVPFSSKKIDTYIERFVEKDKKQTDEPKIGWEVAKYKEYLGSFLGLQEMIRDPFSLKIILKGLPKLRQTHPKGSLISRFQVYEAFTEQWFDNELKRIGRSKTLRRGKQSKQRESWMKHSEEVAMKMFIDSTPFVQKDDCEAYDNERDHFEKGPLYFVEEDNKKGIRFQFIHTSYAEYFAAKYIARNLREIYDNYPKKFRQHFERRVKGFSLADEYNDLVQGPLINRMKLYLEPAIIHFLADIVHDNQEADKKLSYLLFEIIEASKKTDKVTTASANAITILNVAGFSFARRDWAGIRIIGAILDHAMLSGTILEGANLSGVSLRMAYLEGASLKKANLRGADFGESAYLEHPGYIKSVSCSPKERIIASASDNNIYIWDSRSFRERKIVLSGHKKEVTSVGWSYDGTLLASASQDNTVRIWQKDKSYTSDTFRFRRRRSDLGSKISWARRNKFLGVTEDDGNVVIWKLQQDKTRRVTLNINTNKDEVEDLSWSYDDAFLAFVSGRMLYIYDAKKFVKIAEYADDFWINSVSWSNKSNWLAYGGEKAFLFNVKTREKIALKGCEASVDKLVWSHDGILLACASDKHIHVWDTQTSQHLYRLSGHGDINDISWSNDNQYKELISAAYEKALRIWSMETYNLLHYAPKAYSLHFYSVHWSSDGSSLTARNEYEAFIWDFTTGKEVYRFQDTKDWKRVISVDWFSENEVVAVISHDNMLGVCKIKTGKYEFLDLKGYSAYRIRECSWSHDRKFLAFATTQNARKGFVEVWDVWDVANNRSVKSFEIDHGNEYVLAWSHQGHLLALGREFNNLRLWDKERGEEYTLFDKNKIYSHSIFNLAFSHDDTLLAIESFEKTIRLYNIKERTYKKFFLEEGYTRNSLIFSHNDKLLAYTDSKGIHLLRTDTGEKVNVIGEGYGKFSSLAFSPDDKYLAGTYNETIRIWEVETGQVVRIIGGHGLVLKDADFRETIWTDTYPALIKPQGGIVDEPPPSK